MSKNEDEPIKIVDRRRFTDEGDEREDVPEQRQRTEPEAVEAPADGDPGTFDDGGPLPKVDFVTFILSLSQTAVLSLGLGPEMPGGQAPPLDLQSARWTIDALDMIHEKTKGNLTGEEERIFERILAELKMAYVQIAGVSGGTAK